MSNPAVALVVAGQIPREALLSTAETLREFSADAVEFSGAPSELTASAEPAEARWRAIIVASADAALPAALAQATSLPVIRVPWPDGTMPDLGLLQDPGGNLPGPADGGESFATVAIGPAGAKNAALLAVSILALDDPRLRAAWDGFRATQTEAVLRLAPPTLE